MGLATARIGRDHQLVLCDVSQDRLDAAVVELSALGIEADTVLCDVTDMAVVRRLMDRASSAGRVAAVIHTAGVSPQMAPSEQILRINTIGTVNVTEADGRRRSRRSWRSARAKHPATSPAPAPTSSSTEARARTSASRASSR